MESRSTFLHRLATVGASGGTRPGRGAGLVDMVGAVS